MGKVLYTASRVGLKFEHHDLRETIPRPGIPRLIGYHDFRASKYTIQNTAKYTEAPFKTLNMLADATIQFDTTYIIKS